MKKSHRQSRKSTSQENQYRDIFKTRHPFSSINEQLLVHGRLCCALRSKQCRRPMTTVRMQHAETIRESVPSSAQVLSQTGPVICREFADVGRSHHADFAYFHIVLDRIDLSKVDARCCIKLFGRLDRVYSNRVFGDISLF